MERSQVIVGQGDGRWEIRYDSESKGISSEIGGRTVLAPWRTVGDGEWHFITLFFEADHPSGVRLFVDHLAAGPAVSTIGLDRFPHTVDAPLFLGNGPSLGSDTYLHGGLDDLRWRLGIVSGEELLETSAGRAPWIDVSGGHFDAGDYSKYMKNSGLLVHVLVFTLDQILQVSGERPQPFDHLGLPESGDGISDLLQEAKWEADFIAKMQDSDGGFFSMVNPRTRRFENDVTPSEGDRQVVWPKTLIATGVAVGALAQLGHSPAFRAVYPNVANRYREQALRGWDFIEAAVAEHGILGGHQRIFHYGERFQANDELAYAAAALFAMTGDPKYEERLMEWMPYDTTPFNFSSIEGWRPFRRFTWQRLFESVGAAMRTYAFADRGTLSGQDREFASELILGKRYLDHVLDEIVGAGDDVVSRADGSPYGVSISAEGKRFGVTDYFFGASEAFDLIGASLLEPTADYGRALLSNLNFQAGGNPVNVSFLSGLGWAQPRHFVSQWALNDERKLPPIGFTSGSVNSGLPFLPTYGSVLGKLVYPPNVHESTYTLPYGTYHRWADTFHIGNEFVILDHVRSLATMSYLLAEAGTGEEAWVAPPAVSIVGLPDSLSVGESAELGIESVGDLTEARVLWESDWEEPRWGATTVVQPPEPGEAWVELEVLWPDGRRSFDRQVYQVRERVETAYIENFQPAITAYGPEPYRKILGNPNVRAYYPLDGSGQAYPVEAAWPTLTLRDGTNFAPGIFDYPGYDLIRPDFEALPLQGAGSGLDIKFGRGSDLFPADATWLSVEAMVYIEAYAEGVEDGDILDLLTNGETLLRLERSRWEPPVTLRSSFGTGTPLEPDLPRHRWMHLRLLEDQFTITLYIDGEAALSIPAEGFADWLDPQTEISFRVSGFEGWVSDIIIKAGSGAVEEVDPVKEIVPGAPVVRFEPSNRIDVDATYTPDASFLGDADEEAFTYQWTGPSGVQFQDPTVLEPEVSFTASGDYSLVVTVEDRLGKQRQERVFVKVRNFSGNSAPEVDLGAPQALSLPTAWRATPSVIDGRIPGRALELRLEASVRTWDGGVQRRNRAANQCELPQTRCLRP